MRILAMLSFSFGTAIFAAILLPETVLLWLGVGLVVLSLLAWVLLRGTARLRTGLICAGLAAGFLWTVAYLQLFYQPARALDDQTVRLSAVVADWPKPGTYGGYSVLVRAQVGGITPVRTNLYLDEQAEELRPGDRIETVAHLTLAERNSSGEEITYYKAKGIFLWGSGYGTLSVQRPEHLPLRDWPAWLARQMKTGIANSVPEDSAPLVTALVTGNRDNLTDPFTSSLQRTGLSHTVVVSGMHIAFLAGVLAGVLGQGRRRTALVMVPTVLLFMMMAGNTPSVVRASVMVLLLQLAPLFDRERDGPTALGVALMLILAQNPFAAAHVGLQLSFAAVAGILFCSERAQMWLRKPLERKMARRFSLRWMGQGLFGFVTSVLSSTLGALIFTVPLVALYYGSVSLIAPLSNLLTLWAVSWTFVGGLVLGIVGVIWPAMGSLLALGVTPIARYLTWVVPLLGKIPFASVTMESVYYRMWLGFLYLMLLASLGIKGRKRLRVPVCAGVVTLAVSVLFTVGSFRDGELTVTALDVGQGQSVLLRCGSWLALVDCGGSEENAGDTAADYLQDRGIHHLDLLVLTHFHDDHANGVEQLLQRVEVDTMAVPDMEDESRLHQDILSQVEGRIPLEFIREDRTIHLDPGQFVTIFAPLGKGETNEQGLSVLASTGDAQALITGDMGADVEQELLAHTDLPDLELLVVGHHGSKGATSPELLAVTRPETAFVSVGAGNRYGHPAHETMERLDEAGTEIYRTDLHGTLTWSSTASETN